MRRTETIQILYDLLEARVLGRRADRADREYLALLGDGLPALRQRYCAVRVDYTSPETVDRYLLAYFPHYVFTASTALLHIPCALLRAALERRLDLVCIGGGPLPELVALVDRILECGAAHGTINVTSVDVNAATWATAVEDSIAIAKVLDPGLTVQVTTQQRDCTSRLNPQLVLPDCDILMIQNCLNEIGSAAEFPAHAAQFAAAVRPQGFIVVSDLTEYGAVTGVIPGFEGFLETRGYEAAARFQADAAEVRSPFARNVPPRTYWAFFGFRRDLETGEGSFQEWRRPKAWIRFSTAAWRRL